VNVWPTAALGEVATIAREGVDPARIDDGTLYVGLENIRSGGDLVDVAPVARGDLASTKFRFTPDHVLYGKLRPYLAKVARPPFSGICSTDILPILPGGDVDRDYLAQFLLRPESVAWATSRSTGANLPRISPSSLQQMRVPVPPIEDQRRIATLLDRAAEVRARRRATLALLDALAASVFHDVATQTERSGGPAVALGDAVEMVTVGHVGPTTEYFCEDGVPFLRTGNVGALEIDRGDLKRITPEFHRRLKKSALRTGDVLVSRVISDAVRCAVVPADLDGANCANVIVIRPGERVSAEYLAYLIRSPQSQGEFLQRRVGSAQSVVNTRVLQSWRVRLPEPVLRQRFESVVAHIQAVRAIQRQSLTQMNAFVTSLQDRAFTGQL
jgi:type I restriction enzyme, S subunit